MRKLVLALTAAAVALPAATPADAARHRHYSRYHHVYYAGRRCPGHSGTTGAIVGGGAGALVGSAVTHGIAGPVIGGVGGALLGRHIGRTNC
ncbi:MAG TPA: hypothetical protein VH331_17495 [Allosphingosinicella sp.]|nr:hypothetical protein [Allosphingosinicella sp.]